MGSLRKGAAIPLSGKAVHNLYTGETGWFRLTLFSISIFIWNYWILFFSVFDLWNPRFVICWTVTALCSLVHRE
ncbi:hypothetical protein BDW42DRAFT_172586 [Aspergillus taichungensis]|uniref:Uncharacterized protein n=1 Tax=Aspergillus taichungensis TaxID=482145 RepID=A0A2J5HQM9_9EURO|nr:hypothetical protein BDW42DRAFT_172586 [Aspergillus taichungensis]